MERFLIRQVRSYDLILRISSNSWLACFACDESELTRITDRIKLGFSEHNRNRPDGVLPNITFRPVGAWLLSKRPEELTEAIRSAYSLEDRNTVGVH